MKNERMTLFSIGAALAVAAVLLCPLQAVAVPGYDVQHIGTGTVAAINNRGDIAANERLTVEGQNLTRGWVSKNAGAPVYLPLPDGMNQSFVADVNDNGLVVGSVSGTDYVKHAVAWYPNGTGGYDIVDVDSILPPGTTHSYVVAINNNDVMVGTLIDVRVVEGILKSAWTFTYSQQTGLETHLHFPGYPSDINDLNQVSADNLRLNLDTGIVDNLGYPGYPNIAGSHFNNIDIGAMNNNGSVIALGALATGLDETAAIAKYTDAGGWEVVSSANRYAGAFDINTLEDIVYYLSYGCNGSSIVRFEGEGTYCIGSLLADQSWGIASGVAKINDSRQIAVGASNPALGIGGVVRLVPAGDLPLPSAPENLTATLQPVTSTAPNGTIRVTWTNPNTVSVNIEVERMPGQNGEIDFAPVYLSGNGTDGIFYPLELNTTYTYRARACGLTGCSAYSNEASATTPAVGADTTPPVVTFVSPQSGDQVSGNVQIEVNAVDNVAMQYIRVSFAPFNGDAVICTVYQTETASCSWNTRDIQPGNYTLSAQGVDHLNNHATTSVAVELIETTKGGKGNKGNNGGGGKGRKK